MQYYYNHRRVELSKNDRKEKRRGNCRVPPSVYIEEEEEEKKKKKKRERERERRWVQKQTAARSN